MWQDNAELIKRYKRWLPLIGSVFFLLIGLVSVIVLTQQRQDARRQADETSKVVQLQLLPSSPVFRPNTTVSVDLVMNTQGYQVDGVQVVFDITGDAAHTLQLDPQFPSSLRKAWEQVDIIPNGKRVSYALVSANPTQPFTSSSDTRIATLFFRPANQGSVSISFNQEWSKVTAHRTTNDILKDPAQRTFSIAFEQTTPTPTPVVTPSPSVTPTPAAGMGGGSAPLRTSRMGNDHLSCEYENFEVAYDITENGQPVKDKTVKFSFSGETKEALTNTGGRARTTFRRGTSGTVRAVADNFPAQEMYIAAPVCPTPTPVPTLRPATPRPATSYTATPRPTARPATPRPSATPRSITATVKIDSSPTPKPTTTAIPKGGVGAGGKVCNEKCQSSSQCGDQLMCYKGECRLINNVESASCQPKVSEGTKSCNEVCSVSADCRTGLVCHQNKCRLAANLYNVSCEELSTQDQTTVSGSCNQACSKSSDCGVLLDCYQGQCRLPSNPKQTQCLTKEEASRSGLTETETEASTSASASPSPSPVAEEAPADSPSLLSRVLKWLLIAGLVVIVGVVGLLGYAWYQDRKLQAK